MKILLVLATSLFIVGASVVQFSPTLYTAAIPITTQYHDQDGLGQYSYGYSGGLSAKAEYKSLDGVTRGSYTYVDADGELQTVEYTADSANGFQAAVTNLPKAPIDSKTPPKPVEDTAEVAMAKAEHFAAFREAEIKAAEQPIIGEGNGNDEGSSNGSQERTEERSRDGTSAETESPNNLNGSSEQSVARSESSNGYGNGNENGDNGVTRLSSNNLRGLSNGLSSISSSLSSGLLNGNGQLSSSDLEVLSSLQSNGDLTSSFNNNNDALRLSQITPATTSQLRPISLNAVRVPTTSYLSVSTPTHGYSVISPTILTAVPTLRATSSQTISRSLPFSLGQTFLTQKLR